MNQGLTQITSWLATNNLSLHVSEFHHFLKQGEKL